MNEQPMTSEEQLAADQAAEFQAQCEAEARAATWGEAHRRLSDAEMLRAKLDQIGGYITEREAEAGRKTALIETLAAELEAHRAELTDILGHVSEAKATEEAARSDYNKLRGTGKAMLAMVRDECAAKGVPLPQDPPSPLALSPACDHLTCPGCGACSCHNTSDTSVQPLPEPAGGAS